MPAPVTVAAPAQLHRAAPARPCCVLPVPKIMSIFGGKHDEALVVLHCFLIYIDVLDTQKLIYILIFILSFLCWFLSGQQIQTVAGRETRRRVAQGRAVTRQDAVGVWSPAIIDL